MRVPISQGYELYNALKRQGVTTKMTVYPRQPHGFTEPKMTLDAAQREPGVVRSLRAGPDTGAEQSVGAAGRDSVDAGLQRRHRRGRPRCQPARSASAAQQRGSDGRPRRF